MPWLTAAVLWLVVALTGFTGVPLAGTAVESSGPCAGRELIGHRGVAGPTEDTLGAFERARLRGADRVETDIRFIRGDVPVLMHDDGVRRTTTGTGRVADMSAEQWRALRSTDGQRVPFLRDVLGWGRRTGMPLQLELKSETTDRQVQKVARLVREHGRQGRVVVTSFRPRDIRRYAAYDRVSPTALLREGPATHLAWLRHTVGADWVLYDHARVSRADVDTAHRAGLRVGVRTPNTDDGWLRSVRLGADAISTDRVGALSAWCRSYASS